MISGGKVRNRTRETDGEFRNAKLPLISEPVARFNELLHSVSFAIVTTVEQDGNLRSP